MALEVGLLALDKTTRYDYVANQISCLLNQCSPCSEFSEERLHRVAEQSLVIVAADVERKSQNQKFDIIGLCCLVPLHTLSGTVGRIDNFVINEAYFPDNPERRLDIRRRIVEKCFGVARANKITNLEIPARYVNIDTAAMNREFGFVVLELYYRQSNVSESVSVPAISTASPGVDREASSGKKANSGESE